MEAIFVEGSVRRISSRVEARSDLSTRIVARRQRSGGFVKTTLTRRSAWAPFWPKFNSPGLGEYFRINFPGRDRERAAALFQLDIRCQRRRGGRASILGWVEAGHAAVRPLSSDHPQLKEEAYLSLLEAQIIAASNAERRKC